MFLSGIQFDSHYVAPACRPWHQTGAW